MPGWHLDCALRAQLGHEAHRVIPLHRPVDRLGQIIEDRGRLSADTAALGVGQVSHPLGSARDAGKLRGHALGSRFLQRAVGAMVTSRGAHQRAPA